MTWGDPKGSVLGPLLSLLYVNDFIKASSVLDLHLFADDSNLSFSHKDLQTLESIVNNELDLEVESSSVDICTFIWNIIETDSLAKPGEIFRNR